MTSVMVIQQGRELRAEDIGLIQGLLAEHRDWGRTRLSEELCRLRDWRNARGRIKDMAARTLLLKLERGGFIQLPDRRRSSSSGLRNRTAGAVDWVEPLAQEHGHPPGVGRAVQVCRRTGMQGQQPLDLARHGQRGLVASPAELCQGFVPGLEGRQVGQAEPWLESQRGVVRQDGAGNRSVSCGRWYSGTAQRARGCRGPWAAASRRAIPPPRAPPLAAWPARSIRCRQR